MRVLKWLFHPVYLLLIIVIFALYVNREVLFSEEVAESLEVAALVAKVDELAERLRSEAVVETSAITTAEPDVTEPLAAPQGETVAEVSGDEEAVAVVPAEVTVVPVIQAPVADVVPAVSGEGLAGSQSAVAQLGVNEKNEKVPEQVVVTSTVEQGAPEPLPPATVDAPVTPIVPAASSLSTWREARAAVWQGNLDGAVAYYRQLIALQPDNYDAYGEMGNVLLAQSDVAAAVEAYVAAARLIRKSGNQAMARRLVGVVGALDEAQGRALYNEFSQ